MLDLKLNLSVIIFLLYPNVSLYFLPYWSSLFITKVSVSLFDLMNTHRWWTLKSELTIWSLEQFEKYFCLFNISEVIEQNGKIFLPNVSRLKDIQVSSFTIRSQLNIRRLASIRTLDDELPEKIRR